MIILRAERITCFLFSKNVAESTYCRALLNKPYNSSLIIRLNCEVVKSLDKVISIMLCAQYVIGSVAEIMSRNQFQSTILDLKHFCMKICWKNSL